MVGVNSFIHRFGTVAIFATLFAAIQVNGDKGCVYDFEQVTDIDLECNNIKNSWALNNEVKEAHNRKVLILDPEQSGCFKTKNTVVLNATSPVAVTIFHDGKKDENEKITLQLIPKEGVCAYEDCVWDLTNDPQLKSGEWVIASHKFPLKSLKEYYVQFQVEKNKGKLLVERISFPTAFGDSSRCQIVDGGIRAANEAGMNEIGLPSQLSAESGNSSGSFASGFAEISKNLMLTSASVLTINNLLN